MTRPVFIVPGFQGSGAAHWQSWLSERCPRSRRLQGVDWGFPDLQAWADQARAQISRLDTPVWLLAHSFGCLVSLAVTAEIPASVAGLLLVAPADPRRFQAEGGLRERARGLLDPALSVADVLPERLPPGIPSLLLASDNDSWLKLPEARRLAQRWGSPLLNLGAVGHINVDSGFGPWPAMLQALDILEREQRFDAEQLAAALSPGGSATLPSAPSPGARRDSAAPHSRSPLRFSC